MNAIPFLSRVSYAGVPHTLPHSSDISQATLYPLSPKEACRLYWMVATVTIRYAYTLNGVSISREIPLSTTVEPRERLIAPATLYQSQYDSVTQSSYLGSLDLTTVYFDPQNLSSVGFKFSINETEYMNLFSISMSSVSGMGQISKTFDFMGHVFSLYLCYNSQLVTSASLDPIEVEIQFYS